MRKLVLLGGGYGGLRILQGIIQAYVPTDLKIILIDRQPYHSLKTEYYALAAGTASDQHIRVPFPQHPRLTTMYGEITAIDLERKQVLLEDQDPVAYDDLVIGLGSEDNYHQVPGAGQYTHSIQTMDRTRRTFQALSTLHPKSVVAIVGGGLSGVELASELHESRPDLIIKLYDRGKSILSDFSGRLSTYVQNWFIERGVDVINESNITKVEKNILYNHDDPIPVDAVVWTAGIQPSHIVRKLDVDKDQKGRIILTPHHHIPDNPNVYVVGDCASLPHSPSAQLAEEQGDQIVKVLYRHWKGEPFPTLPEIKLKGVLGSLGPKHGFGMMGGTALTGRIARLLKSGVLWLYKRHNA